LTAATLGADGVLAWDRARFYYSPAFDIKAVDTTGSGDVFHAAFAYSLLRGDELPRSLEFSCAAAGFACLGMGARGGIASLAEIEDLIRNGRRRPPVFTAEQLEDARMAR
jgi:sugar/nucleoside kinase (ribokinase family)